MKQKFTLSRLTVLLSKPLLVLLVLSASGLYAQPKITSFTPRSAPPGATVVINGSSFNAAPAGNLVYFGAVRGVVTGSTTTSLSVTVPAGATYQPLSVLNAATGLTGYSAAFFIPAAANVPGFSTSFYQQSTSFSAASLPSTISVGDLDVDGKPDVFVGDLVNAPRVLRNTAATGIISAASFAPKEALTGEAINSNSSAIIDLDGDGKLDIASTAQNPFGTAIAVYRNISSAGSIVASSFEQKTFAPETSSSGISYTTVIPADLDGDGKADLIVGGGSSGTLSVLRNTFTSGTISASSFAAKVNLGTGLFPVAAADVDGDGKPDLLVSDGSGTYSILRNISNAGGITAASFAPKVVVAATGSLATLADLDLDGKPDLVVSSNNTLSLLRNISSPGNITAASFSATTGYTISGQAFTIGDVDADGKPDIVFAAVNLLSVLRNTSTPGSINASSFAARTDFLTQAANPSSVVLADIDADGVPEVLLANRSASNLVVLKAGASGPPAPSLAPSVVSFNPASGPVGTAVTITGTNFGATPAGNIVYFGAVRAVITGASPTSLTVTVPPGASYQPLSVLNTTTGLTGYARQPYITTFTTPFGQETPPDFYRPPVNITADTYTSLGRLAVGDLDGDNKPDLVTVKNSSIVLLHNTSVTGNVTSSSFGFPETMGENVGVASPLVLSDVNGDGKLDIITTATISSPYLSHYVAVYRNVSVPGTLNASSFAAAVLFPIGNAAEFLATGDLDGDGKPEIVTGYTFNLTILRNTSAQGTITASSFAADINLNLGDYIYSVAVADLDGDGKRDLIAGGPNNVSVLRNVYTAGTLNTLSFMQKVDFAASSVYGSIVRVGDIDGDGKPDLATVGNDGSTGKVSVLRNTTVPGSIAASSFARTDFDAKSGTDLSISDVNGNGKPDLVVANGYSKSFSVLNNNTTPGNITPGTSFSRTDFLITYDLLSLAVNDIDGDGIPEVLAPARVGNYDGSVSIFKVGISPAVAVPVISGFSPASAPAGTLITINGSNFNAVPTDNIVYFGAAKAVVTGGNNHSLTVQVPAGATYQPLSVLNRSNGLTAYSAMPFSLAFANPYVNTIPANFYRPKVDFATGSVPYALALGDLDGDGKTDMVTVNSTANTISVLRNVSANGNISTASFAGKTDLAVGNDPRAVSIGDVDGDGKLDIVVANSRAGTVSVLRNIATAGALTAASFAARVDFTTGTGPFSIAMGDLNRDGKPDLVVTNLQEGTLSVLRNRSVAGSITASSFEVNKIGTPDYNSGGYPRSVAIGDINGDGRNDLAVAYERYGSVYVHINSTVDPAAINFGETSSFYTGTGSNCVAIGDLNGDGKPDLAVSNFGDNAIAVLRNNYAYGNLNSSSFGNVYSIATGSSPFFVIIGDADGDGKPDLISANPGSNTLSVVHNTYSADHNNDIYNPGFVEADFKDRTDFSVSGYPTAAALGDLDGDGVAELAATNAGTNTISVLKINPLRLPVISSFTPASGVAGTAVIITGLNFSTTAAANIVYFGAVRAAVTASTATSLSVTVPAGATYKPLSVLNTEVGLTGYSSKPFALLFTNPFGSGIPANFYRPKVDFAAGALPFYTAIGDLDGDGKADLVVANAGTGTVSVLRNTSSSGAITAASFSGKTDFATAADPRSLVLGDVDGDGKLDIMVACASSYTISVLRNTATAGSIGAASFAPRADIPTGVYISSIAAGDLDGDGKPDLVVANLYSNSLSVLRNVFTTGSISPSSFAPKTNFFTGAYPRSLALSDIDGDGRLEIVVANELSNNVSVLRNQSAYGILNSSSFADAINFAVGANPPSVAAGDVDGDGRPDLVVANYGSNTVSVLRNTAATGSIGVTSFAGKVDYATGSNPFFAALGDADGDGKPDIVVTNANSNINTITNTVSLLRNTSSAGSINTASFAGKVDFATGGYPDCAALGDLDGDGVAELVVANAASGVSVFKISAPQAVAVQATAGIRLYPNPTTDDFVVELQSTPASQASLELVSESGKLIERRVVTGGAKTRQYTVRMNLRGQPAGVYYVKVTGVDGVRVMKVVVQR